MPNLGIIASSKSGNLSAPSYDSIATVTLSSSASSISFTSIPSTYKHLQLRLFGQTDQSNYGDGALYRLNSDSGNNYTLHWLFGDGSTATALGFSAYGGLRIAQIAGNVNQPNPTYQFGAAIIDILDYANTNKYKTGRSFDGYDMNGIGTVALASGVWQNTAAVNSITLIPTAAATWRPYTKVALYGIKG